MFRCVYPAAGLALSNRSNLDSSYLRFQNARSIRTEQTLSRKREREVSLEPATPKSAVSAHASDAKSPAKKGRVQLDTTLEEEDGQQRSRSRTPSQPHSPALSVSPPHEVKVRQISQGVEDINWQQRLPLQDDVGPPRADIEVSDDKEDEMPGTQVEATEEVVEVPPCSFTSTQDTVAEAGETEDSASSLPCTRRASESDSGEPDKGLKRKLADRGTSQGPESGPSTAVTTEATKRPRDDVDKDDNPRISKRQSPPPDQDEKPSRAPEKSTSKFGGFMAYASTASPFASVKGQNIFSGASPNNQTNQTKKPPTSPSRMSSALPSNNVPLQSPFASSPFTQSPMTALSLQASLQQTPQGTATKRTGFEAFAGSASPFASAAVSTFAHTRSKSPLGRSGKSVLGRSKSPPRRTPLGMNASAFSSYAGAGPHPKRPRAGSPNGGSSRSSVERGQSSVLGVFGESNSGEGSGSGEEEVDGEREDSEREPSTFGERLRASKDGEDEVSEEEKEKLTEQEVLTGEEEEETIHQVRGKLYVLCPQNQWKERGTGLLKLNVRRSDGGGARLVMRKEAVYTVLLNVTLFQGMKCFVAQDARYIRFSVIENGATLHYNLRLSNAKIANELLEEINANIPS
ncbi:hypothetical protein F5I97DRAFT_100735 [Phlebopus sp. FC_14]|nr:hypothetical protein F5I97DRAFT_100735 [Phlebopus sp. FC_14]